MRNGERPVIMIFCDYYLPGYKSGGGMRTIVNMVDRLSDRYDFRIVTRDHDGKLDRTQYDSVCINSWNQISDADVYYLSKDNIRISTLRSLINEIKPDAIYTNSFFSTLTIYVLKLRKLGLIAYRPVVIAPCGELASGALGVKSRKKKVFLNYAKLIRLYKDVIWKASTEQEAAEVESLKPKRAEIFVAPDMPPRIIYGDYDQASKPKKEEGKVKFAFVSRFVRAKNFNWLLPALTKLKGDISLDVVGPLEDIDYWKETEEAIAEFPPNIKVRPLGPVPHEKINETMLGYHFFLSPSLGENFGHIFLEAMASGCPLLISDRTPWRELEQKGIGWDLSLEKPERWIEVFEQCALMGNDEYEGMSVRARAYSEELLNRSGSADKTERVLKYSLKGKG